MGKFDFDQCRNLLLEAVIDSLRQRSEFVRSIEHTAIGSPVNGLALEVYPWHEQIVIALRLETDSKEDRYSPADWAHYAFANSSEHDFPALQKANRYVSEAYKTGGEKSAKQAREIAHLTFLAAAEALLDQSVARELTSFGIEGPLLTDQFRPNLCFEYMVFDVDQSIVGNYCEIILANRITRRLIASGLVSPGVGRYEEP
jgi:hypothetical protein